MFSFTRPVTSDQKMKVIFHKFWLKCKFSGHFLLILKFHNICFPALDQIHSFFLQLLGGKIEFSDQNNKVCQYDPGAIQELLIVGKVDICFFLFWFRRTFVRKSESNWEVEKQLACLGRSSTKLPAKSQDHFLISYSVFMLLNKRVRFVLF